MKNALWLLPVLMLSTAPAYAVDLTNARIFVATNGNDAKCGPQPMIKGQNPELINPPTIACRTAARACALAKPTMHIEPVTGDYIENVVCHASGTDAAHPVIIHIAEMVKKGPVTFMGVPGANKPTWELTGSYIRFGGAGVHINGNTSGDGLYVHGTDAAHPAKDVEVYYGTAFEFNSGHAVHTRFTDHFLLTGGAVINNGSDCVLIENSPAAHLYSEAVYRCGSVMGNPITYRNGVVVINSPDFVYDEMLGQTEVLKNLVLTSSPNATVTDNKQTHVGYPPFSYVVTPASDMATDTFSGN